MSVTGTMAKPFGSVEAARSIVGIYDASRTGNPYIDGVVSGFRWPTGIPISYGFPTTTDAYPRPYSPDGELDANFTSVSQFMQETFEAFIHGTRSGTSAAMILTPIEGFTNLQFVRNDNPDLNTLIRIASSAVADPAWAYYPGDVIEGDIWFGQNFSDGSNPYTTPTTTTYGHVTAMHELGHALGLKHTFEIYMPEDVAVPGDREGLEYSVMTYNQAPTIPPSFAGGAEPYYTDLRPQTFMMLDIAALQFMYGANYTFRSDDTVYSWSPTTGETFVNGAPQGRSGNGFDQDAKKIFQTIWDGGGNDTYDLSNYTTNLTIDLEPGGSSIFSQQQRTYLAWFGYEYYAANVYNALLYNNDPRSLIEDAKGGSGDDKIKGNIAANHLWGNAGDDSLEGGAGNDFLNGGNDIDTAIFTGTRADYLIARRPDGDFKVTDTRANHDGVDILTRVEFAKFGGQIFRLSDLSPPDPPPVDPPPGDPAPLPLVLTGTSRPNRLKGGAANDKLSGGYGNDVLTGGPGQDVFVFDAKLGKGTTKSNQNKRVNFDTITDFTMGEDKIWLSKKVFKKLGKGSEAAPGKLNKKLFSLNKSNDANDRIIYKKGVVSYDADGSGQKYKPVEFIKIGNKAKLTEADFFIV